MTPTSLLSDLNEQQQKAVEATDGPVLILAGAGSGKTRTLVHRLAYLIAMKKARPHELLAVTFTNKAANEMKVRTAKLLGRSWSSSDRWGAFSVTDPAVGTFHAICVRILRQESERLGFKKNFVIYDDDDQTSLIRKILQSMNLDPTRLTPQAIGHLISQAKNALQTPEDLQNAGGGYLEEMAGRVYEVYQRQLGENHAMDFDDLILNTVRLWQQSPEMLQKYQTRFPYLLIDEYQDTNHAQYVWASLLAQATQNICVVGDDAQGIYSWRGANIQNILDFEKDYPHATVIKLEQNYRSTQTIVEASNAVIRENRHQKPKKLWTQNPRGEKILVTEVADEQEEGEFVARTILGLEPLTSARSDDEKELVYEAEEESAESGRTSLLDRVLASHRGRMLGPVKRRIPALERAIVERARSGDVRYQDFVVLYRTNAQSRAIEEVFLHFSIPYVIIGGVKFYERKEVRDVLAYLRALAHPEDALSMKRIINVPARSLGEKSVASLEAFAQAQKMNLREAAAHASEIPQLGARAQTAFRSFARLVQGLAEEGVRRSPRELIDLVMSRTGYREMLNDGTAEGESRLENIEELKTVAAAFDNAFGTEGLLRFLEEVALVSDVDTIDEEASHVTLMTVHAAKGLEFPTVFLVGMEEGIFPHSRSIFEPGEMEEERRLCYVAMTRAKERLMIVHTAQRHLYGSTQVNMPSRFLDDLPDPLVERRASSSV
jgi:DNA helicase-2/ATP-dependent DNA helicase PcrA